VKRVFPAETAVFAALQPVRSILFVLGGVVVSLPALGTCQGNFYSHLSGTSILAFLNRDTKYLRRKKQKSAQKIRPAMRWNNYKANSLKCQGKLSAEVYLRENNVQTGFFRGNLGAVWFFLAKRRE